MFPILKTARRELLLSAGSGVACIELLCLVLRLRFMLCRAGLVVTSADGAHRRSFFSSCTRACEWLGSRELGDSTRCASGCVLQTSESTDIIFGICRTFPFCVSWRSQQGVSFDLSDLV
ncbi:hypothetical protein LZ30DRAFT_421702 [Colletotrichum cereale]|nr:hypothetical protein LZ30DRAFT_421702 [Colletotrichum cereale]